MPLLLYATYIFSYHPTKYQCKNICDANHDAIWLELKNQMIAGQYYLFEPTTLKTYLKVQRLALRILHFSDTHLGFNYFEIVNESSNKIGSLFNHTHLPN